jgi:hypothetical protein
MQVEDSNCYELIEKTANALNSDTLKLLFVSVQQNNIDLCIKYAVRQWVHIFFGSDMGRLFNSTVRW